MDTEELAVLRELAENATPGPWFRSSTGNPHMDGTMSGPYEVHPDSGHRICVTKVGNLENLHNANYIAAANPETIINLLDSLSSLKNEHDRILRLADETHAKLMREMIRADRLARERN